MHGMKMFENNGNLNGRLLFVLAQVLLIGLLSLFAIRPGRAVPTPRCSVVAQSKSKGGEFPNRFFFFVLSTVCTQAHIVENHELKPSHHIRRNGEVGTCEAFQQA